MLAEKARYCGCQLIIATHSPFLLAIDGARIYDLDSSPVEIKKWWQLDNTRIYYDFFIKHRELFESGKKDINQIPYQQNCEVASGTFRQR